MLTIPWQSGVLSIPVKDDSEINILQPEYPLPLKKSSLKTLIQNDLETLAVSIKEAGKIVLILEDPSRVTRTNEIVELICKGVKEIRGSWGCFEIIMAAGAHFNLQPGELKRKVANRGLPLTIHNCIDEAHLARVGISKSGIPLYFNKSVADADLRLSISTLNIHPLAGYSGGAKILLPGVAGLKTIQSFHGLPPGKPGIETSAMRELINEVLLYLPVTYSWHLISNPDGEIIKIFGAKIDLSFQQAKLELTNLVTVEEPRQSAQMLILGCKPFDQNLIGTFKSFHQIPLLLSPGGKAILFNEASQGIGFHYWRTAPEVIAEQKQLASERLKDYQIAVYSPFVKPNDFRNIFPESFFLLSTFDDINSFMGDCRFNTLTVLPFAPITLISQSKNSSSSIAANV